MQDNIWCEKIEKLNILIRKMLSSLLYGEKTCALVMYPNHWNSGDMAIWCGIVKILRELGIRIDYCCSCRNYFKKDLERKVKDGPILICGGGNFGDVYKDEVGLRNRIFQDFPHRKVIQLPQSIYFKNSENIIHANSLIQRMKDFTLLVRDQDSFKKAQEYFDCRVAICPDAAFALGDLVSMRTAPTTDIFWLRRIDSETQLPIKTIKTDLTILIKDWLEPGEEVTEWPILDRKLLRFDKFLNNQMENGVSIACTMSQYLMPWYQRLARLRVMRGCGFLSQGKVVICDRLHGHILSILLGIPHVLMNNNYNKIRSFHETWTYDFPKVHWANDMNEAAEIVKHLL